jgi:hypothetical protein
MLERRFDGLLLASRGYICKISRRSANKESRKANFFVSRTSQPLFHKPLQRPNHANPRASPITVVETVLGLAGRYCFSAANHGR